MKYVDKLGGESGEERQCRVARDRSVDLGDSGVSEEGVLWGRSG